MRKSNILFFIILFCMINFSVFAKSSDYKENYYFPYLVGNILGEYNLSIKDSGSSGNKIYNDGKVLSYLQLESNLNIHIFNNLSIKTNTIIKPVLSRLNNRIYSGNDYYGLERYMKRKKYFDRYDVIFEELALEYREEEFLFGIGKFNPTFGTAHDKSKYHPTFGTKISEDYELTEKIGFYFAMTLPMLTLRGNFFYNDSTILSNSLFNHRKEYKKLGNVADSKSIQNFSVSADFSVDDYKINLGFRMLEADNSNYLDEKGYVIGVERLIENCGNGFDIIPFFEYVFMKNYKGERGRDMNYFTARLPFIYNSWNIIASYSGKFDQEKGFKDYKTYLAQIGIGYKFNNGLMLDVSKNFERQSYKISSDKKTSFKINSIDARLSYMIKFEDK